MSAAPDHRMRRISHAKRHRETNGFPPVASEAARVLILGTLPSQRSLQQLEYYAQPRNVFWRIMGDLLGAGPQLTYVDRTKLLVARNVALWDVCSAAGRLGSLDSSIQAASVVANDFTGFFAVHRNVRLICLNGATAAVFYERHVLAGLSQPMQKIRRECLPSTSSAYASMPYNEKKRRWSVICEECGA